MWELIGTGVAGGLATLAASCWALWERGSRWKSLGDMALISVRNAELEASLREVRQTKETVQLRLEEVILAAKEREHDLTSALEAALGPGAVGELLDRLYGSQDGSPATPTAESMPSGRATPAAAGSEVEKPLVPEVL